MSFEEIKKQIAILKLQIEKLFATLKNEEFKKTIPNLPKPVWIIIHHGGGDWDFSQVNKHHTELWRMISSLGFGIGYAYWISYQGKVIQARRDNEEGAHTIGLNKCSIGIGLQGDFTKEQPTHFQLDALKGLIDKKKAEYGIKNSNVEGHRHFSNTSCPGKNLYSWLIKTYPNV